MTALSIFLVVLTIGLALFWPVGCTRRVEPKQVKR